MERPARKKMSAAVRAKLGQITSELVNFAALDVSAFGKIHEALWREHTEQHKQIVLDAAALTESKARCVVLGAGPCYDIPLQALAEMFDQVALFDLNPAAMELAVAELPEPLAQKVTCTAVELTLALPPALYQIKQELQKAGTRSQRAINKAIGVLRKQQVGPGEIAHIDGDLIISDMILSQLPTALWLVDEWYTSQFQKSIADDESWLTAMAMFKEQLQNAHIEALLSKQDAVVVLSTDYGNAPSADDAHLNGLRSLQRLSLANSTIQKIIGLQIYADIERTWIWHRDDSPPMYAPVWSVVCRPSKL